MSRLITATAAALLATCMYGPAHASQPGGGCPGGHSNFVLWDVSTEPYGADNFVDERGNNDGWVCAKPLHVVTDEEGNPFQIYNFLDNKFHG